MSVDLNCKGFMLLQPVSLVTPGPLRTLSLKRTPLPHLGKRKHSSEQVIFTVHSSTVFIQIKKLNKKKLNKMKKKKKKTRHLYLILRLLMVLSRA